MSTGALIGIIIAVIVVVAVIVVASVGLRRARLRRQFGPEYDRLAQKLGSRKQADAELTARQKRVHGLGIHELSADQQASYSGDWTAVQERFVDTPADAVDAADTLIWSVMRDRGYPANDRNTSMDALSVYHPSSLEGYRKTQEVSLEAATTEQLREAMIRYRAMFEDLTGLKEAQSEPRQDRVAEIRDRAATNSAAADADVRDEQVPVTEAPAAGTRAAGTRAAGTRAADDDVTARDLAAENSERTADTPR